MIHTLNIDMDAKCPECDNELVNIKACESCSKREGCTAKPPGDPTPMRKA